MQRFLDAKPRGLTNQIGNYYPGHSHVVGTAGEGRDKNVVSTPTNDPFVNGVTSDSSPPASSFSGIVVVDGVLKHATIDGTIGADV